MTDAGTPIPGSARGSALFLAHTRSGLEPLRPLLRVWGREASQRFREAQAWEWAHKPWGIGVLHDIARDLGWQVEHGQSVDLLPASNQAWPVGWKRSVEFSLQSPGSGTRWAFAVRRLLVAPGTRIDARTCGAALRSALRVLRRLPLGPNDVGIAAVELRIPIRVGASDESECLERVIDRLHHVRQRLGADGLLVHAVPSSAHGDTYAERVMASLLAIC